MIVSSLRINHSFLCQTHSLGQTQLQAAASGVEAEIFQKLAFWLGMMDAWYEQMPVLMDLPLGGNQPATTPRQTQTMQKKTCNVVDVVVVVVVVLVVVVLVVIVVQACPIQCTLPCNQ